MNRVPFEYNPGQKMKKWNRVRDSIPEYTVYTIMLNLKILLNCKIVPHHWPLTIVLHRIHKKCLWDNPIVRKLKFSNLSDRNRLKIGPIKFLWKSNFYFWDRSQLLCILAHSKPFFKFWVKSLRPFLKVKMYEIPMDNTYCIIFFFWSIHSNFKFLFSIKIGHFNL